MSEFKISVDLSDAMNAVPIIDRHIFPLLNKAVQVVAQKARAEWMKSVYKAKLRSGEQDAYATSITWNMTGPFSAIVETDYKNAQDIETGRPPYDLKQMLNTSPKVRRTKDGRRFMIIPMRANTPGNTALAAAMPQAVYDAASQLDASKVVGHVKRASGELTALHAKWGTRALKKQTPFASSLKTRAPMMVRSRITQWGGKLDTSNIEGLTKKQKKQYNGMYRMEGRTPGGGKYSSYMTFRVMMEGSTGWIIPAKPGLYLAQKTAAKVQPLAEKFFREAISRSFK
jgi:hypothetical protein